MAFQKIPALIQAGVQHISANAPKPPPDPMVAVAMQEVQGKQQIAQGQLSIAQQKAQADGHNKMAILQAKMQQAQQDYQLEMQRLGIQTQTEIQTTDMTARADLEKTAMDNQSAQNIAGMKIASDHATRLSDGASLNKGD
jgi:hypothetical protein